MTHVQPSSTPRKRRSRRVPELMPVSLPGRPANSNRTGADIIPLNESPRRRFQRELAEAERTLLKSDGYICQDEMLCLTLLCFGKEHLRDAWRFFAYGSPEERTLFLYLRRKAERIRNTLDRLVMDQAAIVVSLTTGHTVEGRA